MLHVFFNVELADKEKIKEELINEYNRLDAKVVELRSITNQLNLKKEILYQQDIDSKVITVNSKLQSPLFNVESIHK